MCFHVNMLIYSLVYLSIFLFPYPHILIIFVIRMYKIMIRCYTVCDKQQKQRRYIAYDERVVPR
jgi:hypothetical protein